MNINYNSNKYYKLYLIILLFKIILATNSNNSINSISSSLNSLEYISLIQLESNLKILLRIKVKDILNIIKNYSNEFKIIKDELGILIHSLNINMMSININLAPIFYEQIKIFKKYNSKYKNRSIIKVYSIYIFLEILEEKLQIIINEYLFSTRQKNQLKNIIEKIRRIIEHFNHIPIDIIFNLIEIFNKMIINPNNSLELYNEKILYLFKIIETIFCARDDNIIPIKYLNINQTLIQTLIQSLIQLTKSYIDNTLLSKYKLELIYKVYDILDESRFITISLLLFKQIDNILLNNTNEDKLYLELKKLNKSDKLLNLLENKSSILDYLKSEIDSFKPNSIYYKQQIINLFYDLFELFIPENIHGLQDSLEYIEEIIKNKINFTFTQIKLETILGCINYIKLGKSDKRVFGEIKEEMEYWCYIKADIANFNLLVNKENLKTNKLILNYIELFNQYNTNSILRILSDINDILKYIYIDINNKIDIFYTVILELVNEIFTSITINNEYKYFRKIIVLQYIFNSLELYSLYTNSSKITQLLSKVSKHIINDNLIDNKDIYKYCIPIIRITLDKYKSDRKRRKVLHDTIDPDIKAYNSLYFLLNPNLSIEQLSNKLKELKIN